MGKKITLTVLAWTGTAFAFGVTTALSGRAALDSFYDQTYVQKGSYLLKVDVAQNYLPKDQVERDYITKREVAEHYIPKTVHDETVKQLADLQMRIQKKNEVVSIPPRQLDVGEKWVSQRPPFVIEYSSYLGVGGDISAQIQSITQEGGASSYWLDSGAPPKRYDVTYEGKVYGVLCKLRKVGNDYKVHVSVSLIN